MVASTVDIGFLVLLVVGGRGGYRRGLGELIWPLSRWVLILLLGAWCCTPAAASLAPVIRLSPRGAAVVAYVAIGLVITISLDLLQRRFGDRLAAATPGGELGSWLGLVAGVFSSLALLLVAFALLHPVGGTHLDWEPGRMTGAEAVNALGEVILGNLRRLLLEESWLGGMAASHLTGLLIPAGP
jgi:hypothetical protein